MFDCAKDVLSYHDDEVTLSRTEQKNMRERRDANRKRLKDGLKKAGRPAPLDFETQGSYAMRTMIQLPGKDWDIDDGVYFDTADLKGERSGDMTALEVRQMVRDALDDGSFKGRWLLQEKARGPDCVRVYYDAGYHVDVPVYRIRIADKDATLVELASTDWKQSDARDVTDWFEDENGKQSPDTDNGRQLRRITRDIKKYAQSRESWRERSLGGFGITKLVTECFHGSVAHEDEALVKTLRGIRDRLERDFVVKHPVTPNETITKGADDASAGFFRDKVKEGLESLEIIDDPLCTRTQALAAWDQFYATDYFSKRDDTKARVAASASDCGTGHPHVTHAAAPPPVRKEGGGRYA